MLASQLPDYSDDTSLVIPEQAPIRVFTDDGGVVVINQHQWRESEDEVYILFRPEHAAALCRAILKEAGIDPETRGPEVRVKDGTANERQRRRREKLRDSHAHNSVTVTAELANDVDGPHQENGSTTAAD
jgi:hypothetical protein